MYLCIMYFHRKNPYAQVHGLMIKLCNAHFLSHFDRDVQNTAEREKERKDGKKEKISDRE